LPACDWCLATPRWLTPIPSASCARQSAARETYFFLAVFFAAFLAAFFAFFAIRPPRER
jgi:hypothetical protein